jgi:hypothetical protein
MYNEGSYITNLDISMGRGVERLVYIRNNGKRDEWL